jgi:hypothetical protein
MPIAPFRGGDPRLQPPRIATWPILVVGFSGLVLVILSGAFLVGLALVGLLAAAISGRELLRRGFWRAVKAPNGAFGHR